jgi:hypothetical protein
MTGHGCRAWWLLGAALLSGAGWAHPWRELYGDQLLFDVYRDGDRIGSYSTRFSGDSERWRMEAEMKLELSWMFWRYRYRYQGTEYWRGDQLQRLWIEVDDDGDRSELRFERDNGSLRADGLPAIELPVLPSHHYNRDLTRSERLLNTLTGRLNRVQVEPLGPAQIQGASGSIDAQGYRYSGDLRDTEAWYDASGRWVGLRFVDRRGGRIEFRCRSCTGPLANG